MRRATILAAAVSALVSAGVQAQNWEFTPRLELGYEYSDNYRLGFPGQEIEASGPMMDVTLPVRLIDPIRKFEIAPRVRANYFPSEKEEDSSDYSLDVLFEQRSQRQRFGFDADWRRQDVVRSELPSPDEGGDLGDPTIGDAGRILLRNERDLTRFRPYWRYDVTQRHRAEAGGHYLNADYDQNFEGSQRDYTDYGVYAGWGWLLSQRTSITLRARASRYETSFDADGYGAEVEWRSDYSETAQIYVRLGGQQTDIDRANASSESSIVAGLGGRWRWPTSNLFVDFTRTVGPNAAGAVVERDELRLRMIRALQPRLSFKAGLRGTRDEALNSATYPEREYLTGEVGFEWRITRKWALVGDYKYIWQEYSDEPSDRSSNSVNLGIVYEPGRGE
jgi:hypothetical protein